MVQCLRTVQRPTQDGPIYPVLHWGLRGLFLVCRFIYSLRLRTSLCGLLSCSYLADIHSFPASPSLSSYLSPFSSDLPAFVWLSASLKRQSWLRREAFSAICQMLTSNFFPLTQVTEAGCDWARMKGKWVPEYEQDQIDYQITFSMPGKEVFHCNAVTKNDKNLLELLTLKRDMLTLTNASLSLCQHLFSPDTSVNNDITNSSDEDRMHTFFFKKSHKVFCKLLKK